MHKEQLEYFALAYQTRSFSAAAARVPMSPQGLAKSIRSLEVELGVTLFNCDANGVRVPTEYADELMQFVSSFELSYEALKESFRKIQARERHEIRLGASLGTIGLMGPDFFDTFHEEHDDIRVSYTETNDALCDEGLRRGSYDLALTIWPYPKEFITRELYSTQVCYWVNADDPLSERETLTVADFEGRNIAIPGKDFKCYHSLLAACAEQGVEPREIMASQEIFWLFEFALDGRGLGFTLQVLAELPVFSNHDSVVARSLEGSVWHFGISYLPSHVLAPYEQTFYDYCLAYAATVLRSPGTNLRYSMLRSMT
ncbi:MAG: LysR family transcriptional regulator [Coriobacteriia bacterium]